MTKAEARAAVEERLEALIEAAKDRVAYDDDKTLAEEEALCKAVIYSIIENGTQ